MQQIGASFRVLRKEWSVRDAACRDDDRAAGGSMCGEPWTAPSLAIHLPMSSARIHPFPS